MKKRVLSALLAACLVLTMAPVAFAAEGAELAGAPAAQANSYNVSSDVAVIRNGNVVGESDSLSEALDAYAQAGDTVLLYGDLTLTETVTVDETVTIDGQGSYTISKDAQMDAGITVDVAARSTDSVTLQNLTLHDFGLTVNNGAVTLNNVTIENESGDALAVSNGSVTVASGTYNGKVAVTGGTLTVTGGTFSDSAVSQYLQEGYRLVEQADGTMKVEQVPTNEHAITTQATGSGRIEATADSYTVAADGTVYVQDGTDVTFTFTPDTGYEVQSAAYTVGADTAQHAVSIPAAGGSFTAYHVADDMTVFATFVETDNGGSSGGGGGGAASYRITVEETEHGTVTVNRTSAARGTRVTITVDPDNGYALGTLSVTDRNGNEVDVTRVNSTTYTFQMPNSRVTVSATFVADNTLPFTDVSVSDWFYEAVRYVYDRGLMNGITSTTFGPNRTTERGMIVTILYRLEGEPAVGASTFSDVASNFYYTDAIAWAAENDIVNGYPDGTFRPGQAITRQEMATILYRYASYKGYDVSASASLSGYTDAAQVGAYAADAMAWANATGLVTGTTVTTLTPTGGATRAQVATILMRFLNTLA